MRLNPDCIRDIILTIEEVTDFYTAFEYPDNEYERLVAYSEKEVLYHLKQCDLNNLVLKYQYFMTNSVSIEDLSPKGHEFINVIRSDTIWTKIKKKLSNLAAISMPALIDLAVSYGKSSV